MGPQSAVTESASRYDPEGQPCESTQYASRGHTGLLLFDGERKCSACACFRFRSRKRDQATDEQRLALIRKVVHSAVADAQAESKGLRARIGSARSSVTFLIAKVDDGGQRRGPHEPRTGANVRGTSARATERSFGGSSEYRSCGGRSARVRPAYGTHQLFRCVFCRTSRQLRHRRALLGHDRASSRRGRA
jgi:hypothetical protein